MRLRANKAPVKGFDTGPYIYWPPPTGGPIPILLDRNGAINAFRAIITYIQANRVACFFRLWDKRGYELLIGRVFILL